MQIYSCEYAKEFIFVSFISYCIIFHTNNSKPAFASSCIPCPVTLGCYTVWEPGSDRVSLSDVQSPDCTRGQVLYGLVFLLLVGRWALRLPPAMATHYRKKWISHNEIRCGCKKVWELGSPGKCPPKFSSVNVLLYLLLNRPWAALCPGANLI